MEVTEEETLRVAMEEVQKARAGGDTACNAPTGPHSYHPGPHCPTGVRMGMGPHNNPRQGWANTCLQLLMS